MKKIIIAVLTAVFIFSCSWVTLEHDNPADPDYQGEGKKYSIYITYSDGRGGSESLKVNVASAVEGAEVTLTANIESGRKVELSSKTPGVTITPSVITSQTDKVTITMPARDVEITAVFSDMDPAAKDITSFVFEKSNNSGLTGTADVTGVINESDHTIAVIVPYGTAFTALVPTISLSPEATVSPGTAQDFTNPVTYRVTAQDGTTQDYRVTMNFGYEITLSLNGQQGDESVIASHEIAVAGTEITLTVSGLGTGLQVAISAPGISISPSILTADGTTAAFTMPAGDVTVKATFSDHPAGFQEMHNADSVNFDMHYLPAGGPFTMGENVQSPTQKVTLTKNFWMGETEVTQGLWEKVWGGWPSIAPSSSSGDGNDYPAYFVNWYDAAAFCNLLTVADSSVDNSGQVYYSNDELTNPYTKANAAANASVHVDWSKKGYRLPTEAEWEYAARYIGGTSWNGGDHVSGGPVYTNSTVGDYAWYSGNNSGSAGEPTYGNKEVGQKLPNALGLKDMSGNVYEWCYDWHDTYSGESVTDPRGSESGWAREIRGGSWSFIEDYLQLCYRYYNTPDGLYNRIGFRLCRTAD